MSSVFFSCPNRSAINSDISLTKTPCRWLHHIKTLFMLKSAVTEEKT